MSPLPSGRRGGAALDLRHAVRSLARQKTHTLAAVACIALGIGANTAVFTVVDAVLLHPLPVPWLDRLVVVQDEAPGLGLHGTDVSPAEAVDVAARRDLFDASTAFTTRAYNLAGSGEPRRVRAAATHGDFFGVFGVRPALGRLYGPADSYDGDPAHVVLSHGFWRSQLGGDPAAVGRVIRLDGSPYQVVGVLPAAFRYPREAQLFVPFRYEARLDLPRERGTLIMTAVSRLRPGVSLERARAGLRDEALRWRQRFAATFKYESVGHTLVARPLVEVMAGPLRRVALLLAGAVAAMLLIACANVAALQSVRGMARARELAVRAAHGATPALLARALLAEVAAVVGVGAALGVGLGALLTRLLAAGAPADGGPLELRLSPSVLALTVAATVLAVVLVGLSPALRAGRADPAAALKEAAWGTSSGRGDARLLHRIATVQVALTTVLLLCSGVLARSLDRLLRVDPGFRAEGVVTASVSLPENGYSGERVVGFFDQLLQKAAEIPGVASAGLSNAMPLSGLTDSSPFTVAGRWLPPDASPGHADMITVSDGYFRTLGIPLLRGRLFTPADDARAPRVVVVSQELARAYFPGEDPIGRRIDQGRPATIIGVVADAQQTLLGAPPKAATYYSYRQRDWIRTLTLGVRTTGTADVGPAIRRAVGELDPALALYDVRPLEEVVRGSVAPRRFAALTVAGFAAASLLLTVAGVYGLLSYVTARRARELAIRMALGARPGEVTRMVLAGGARIVAAGVGLGVAAFLAMGGALRAFLYGVGPADPLTLAGAAALLSAVVLGAVYLPARRAARTNPADALREA